MPASISTAVSPLAQKVLGKNIIPFFQVIIDALLQRLLFGWLIWHGSI
jgi:hypothetical protein